jgi:hypothetical protein
VEKREARGLALVETGGFMQQVGTDRLGLALTGSAFVEECAVPCPL